MYLGLVKVTADIRLDNGEVVNYELKTPNQASIEFGFKHETQLNPFYTKVDDNGVSRLDYTRLDITHSNRLMVVVNEKYEKVLSERKEFLERKKQRAKEKRMRNRGGKLK